MVAGGWSVVNGMTTPSTTRTTVAFCKAAKLMDELGSRLSCHGESPAACRGLKERLGQYCERDRLQERTGKNAKGDERPR